MVFIQFAGFTFGKSASAYATPWNGYPGNNNSFLMGGADYVTGVNNIQYTAQFGNGVSGTIGLDDPTVFNRTSVLQPGVAVSRPRLGTNAYGGMHVPDIAATSASTRLGVCSRFRVCAYRDRFVQHPQRRRRSDCSVGNLGSPRRQVGRCCDGCVADQEHPDRCGRRYQDRRNVLKGNTKAVISTSGGSPNFVMFGDTGIAGGYQSVGFGADL